MRVVLRSLAAAIVVSMLPPIVGGQTPSTGSGQAAALFHEGLLLERAEGKIEDAIFRYERVIAEFPKDKDIVPQALYHLALAYEKSHDTRATVLLTRLVTDYPTAMPYARDARSKLAATQSSAKDAFKTRALDATFELGSPDGKLVVYHKNDVFGRLYLRDLKSRAERLLVDLDGYVSNLAWSPDSRRIAFNYQREAPAPAISEIRVVTVASGEVTPLGVRGYPNTWTTSGEIFFYRPNYPANTVDWWLVQATGGEPRKIVAAPLSDTGGFALIAPDGRSVLVARNSKIVLRDIATSAERPLTTGSAEEARLVFSPDSRLVAFASNPDGQWALYAASTDRIPVRTPVRVASVDRAIVGPARSQAKPWWTADGVLTLPVRHADSEIYRIAMDRTTGRAIETPERLTQDTPQNSWPVVSPDGKSVAYTYRSITTGGIAVMNADGTGERPLVELKGTLPIFWRAPDELLFYDFATAAGQKPAITSLNVKTGARQTVTQVEGLYWYYVPARREILHSHPGGGGAKTGMALKAHSLVAGTDRTVATIDYLMPRIAVAPDGRRFAYGVTRDTDNAAARCEIAIMSIDGVLEKVLIPMQQPCASPGSWSPDGRFLLLNTTQGPRVANVETGEWWPLRADMTNPAEWGSASWAPDGSFVVLARSSSRIERLAWEGVTYDAVMKLMNAQRK